MKRIVDEAKQAHHSPEIIRIELKEYLQYFVLDYLYNSEFKSPIFYGGSCLRILYDLPRMSEDLDFEAEEGKIDFHALLQRLEKHFSSDLLMKRIKIAPNKERNIIRILLIFPIARELGLSAHEDETLKIKVEIRLVSHEYMKMVKWIFTPLAKYGKTFVVKHYDLSVLMATKLAAILERPEKGFQKGHPDEGIKFKGRDFYDLLWYMDKGILPSENMLRANRIVESIGEVFDKIAIQISKMDIQGIQKDIENLFIQPGYVQDWTDAFRANFTRLKEKRYCSKKNLHLDEIFIGQDYDSGRFVFRFQFLSDTRDIVTFLFHLSDYFVRFKEGVLTNQSMPENDKTKIVFGRHPKEEDKNRLLSYSALFLELIRNHLKKHDGAVFFEKWESKLIRMSEDKHNPAEEIILKRGQELESGAWHLEDLRR